MSHISVLKKLVSFSKRQVHRILKRFGYQIFKIVDIYRTTYQISKVVDIYCTTYQISKIRDIYLTTIYKQLYDESTLSLKPFYNVGAGSFWHPHWTNIDYISNWYGGVQKKDVIHYDLMSKSPLPIETDSAKIIYTSHTIEHVKEDAVQNLFNEAYRVLDRGGIFRITTGPDAETEFRALINNDQDWFYWDRSYEDTGRFEHIFTAPATSVSLAERWLHHVAHPLSRIDISPSSVKLKENEIWEIINKFGFPKALDYFCSLCNYDPLRPGNHISWWTHEKIIDFLKKAGFTKIYRSGFNQSASPLMRHSPLFDSTHPQMSIYVEAIKS